MHAHQITLTARCVLNVNYHPAAPYRQHCKHWLADVDPTPTLNIVTPAWVIDSPSTHYICLRSSSSRTRKTSEQSLRADPADLHPGKGATVHGSVIGEDAFMLLEEDEHIYGRKAITPAFHQSIVADQSAILSDIVEQEVALWPVGEITHSIRSFRP